MNYAQGPIKAHTYILIRTNPIKYDEICTLVDTYTISRRFLGLWTLLLHWIIKGRPNLIFLYVELELELNCFGYWFLPFFAMFFDVDGVFIVFCLLLLCGCCCCLLKMKRKRNGPGLGILGLVGVVW